MQQSHNHFLLITQFFTSTHLQSHACASRLVSFSVLSFRSCLLSSRHAVVCETLVIPQKFQGFIIITTSGSCTHTLISSRNLASLLPLVFACVKYPSSHTIPRISSLQLQTVVLVASTYSSRLVLSYHSCHLYLPCPSHPFPRL